MRNIKIIYILSFFNRLWFWSGIWVFYYLLFTDYAGIGLIEALMIFAFIVAEIPSGAIADLLGKKRAIILSFILLSLGSVVMAVAPSYVYLLVSVFILSIGSAFYSGSAEAIAYDTLKEKKKEVTYDKVISNIKTIELIALSAASAIGGFMYNVWFGLPFLAVGVAGLFGAFVALFLSEPRIDADKFSLSVFIKQNKQGLKELFKTPQIKQQTTLLLSICFFVVMAFEMLNDVLAVEFGLEPYQMGILWSISGLLAAAASQTTPKLNKKLGLGGMYIFIGISIGITLLISPVLGVIIGSVTIMVRAALQAIFENLTSIVINKNTESKYRATTISTFNFLKNIPYISVVYFMGYIMDLYSAKVFAGSLGLLLIVFVAVVSYRNKILSL